MIIDNKTLIPTDLVKEIAVSMGLDLGRDDLMVLAHVVDAGSYLDQAHLIDGSCKSVEVDGRMVTWIGLREGCTLEVLAHELRHAAQAQVLGAIEMNELYIIEEEIEGYQGNVLEMDAKEWARQWAKV